MEDQRNIDFACPECGKVYLQRKPSLSGKKAKCKACGKAFTISVLSTSNESSSLVDEFQTPYKFLDAQYYKVLQNKSYINGREVKDKFYTIEFPDHRNIIRQLPALDTKIQSKLMLKNIRSLVEYRVKGWILTDDKYRFLQSLPDDILKKVAEWDIIEQDIAKKILQNRKICPVCKKTTLETESIAAGFAKALTKLTSQILRTTLISFCQNVIYAAVK